MKSPSPPTGFQGFEPLDANYVYCPNQFFDVCLRHSSRGVVRLVAHVMRRTLGWLDENGRPIEQEFALSYSELVREAGISRSMIRQAIDEAVAGGFIVCTRAGQAGSAGNTAHPSRFALRWDGEGEYTTNADSFKGFYAGEGYRSPIPNSFFDHVVRRDSLAVVKVVGTVLRHTVGYQNQFGGRRSCAPLSYSYIQQYAGIADRKTVSQALRQATGAGYILAVENGCFDASSKNRRPASYAIHWLAQASRELGGTKTPPANRDQCESPTNGPAPVRKPHQSQSENPTSTGTKIPPAERSEKPTKEKKPSNDTIKQQQSKEAAVARKNATDLLKAAGFDDASAKQLAAKHSVEKIQRQTEWIDARKPTNNRLGMLRRAIEGDWSAPAAREKRREWGSAKTLDYDAIIKRKEEKRKARAERVAAWHRLPDSEQRKLYDRAIEQCSSPTQRSHLRCNRDLENPATEVLVLMDSHAKAAIGESQ